MRSTRRGTRGRAALVVGIAGGVAAGKSTVARLLAGPNDTLLEADRIGHRLLEPGRVSWREVRRAFGPGVVRGDGTIDRRALGCLVFRREEARRLLNDIVHPRLLRELEREIRRASGRAELVVVDAALLVEWGWAGRVDVLVVVECPRAIQLRRLMRRGLSRGEAEDRVRSQLGRRAMRGAADVVLVNDGDKRALGARARALRGLLVGGDPGRGTLRNRRRGLKIRSSGRISAGRLRRRGEEQT